MKSCSKLWIIVLKKKLEGREGREQREANIPREIAFSSQVLACV